MIIFQKPGSRINWKWNVRLNGYKLTLSDQIKYLGIYLDKYLNGHYQSKLTMQKLAKYLGIYLDKYLNGHYQSKLNMQKLARSLGMLSKFRHYVQVIELKNI